MVFNNAQFVGIPLDVVVRKFREGMAQGCRFDRLTDVWPDFAASLLALPRDVVDEAAHLQQFAFAILQRVHDSANQRYFEQVRERWLRPRSKVKVATPRDLLVEGMRRHQEHAGRRPLEGFLASVTVEQFVERFGAALNDVAETVLTGIPYDDEVRATFHALMFAIIKSKARSNGFTGFVVGGFGEEDLFPTLHSVEVDGVYFDTLRVLVNEVIDIDRRGETAAIVPFAQKDMPQRFIYGLDDVLQNRIERIISGVVDQIIAAKPRVYRGGLGNDIRAAAQASVSNAINDFKEESEQKLKSVVNFMSKRELAEIAHSLVELTSRKRRYSDELETVGGPIDVAVLTRNEGFIWIRRKHYFDASLNPSYFVRNAEGRRHGHEPGRTLGDPADPERG